MEKVILIDEANLGGTCLNVGCMPTKSLLESAEVHDIVRKRIIMELHLTMEVYQLIEAIAGEEIANRNAARPRNSIFNEEK